MMYTCLYTALTCVYSQYDAVLLIADWMRGAGFGQEAGGLLGFAKGLVRGAALGVLSYAAILPNFSIPYSSLHHAKVVISLLAIVAIDAQCILQSVWTFTMYRHH